MVISFSVREAREQLLNKGVVYTFRWTRRAFFRDDKGNIEHTWANKKRGGKRIADVDIEEIGEFPNDFSLDTYVHQSGFSNTDAWLRKILQMGNPHGLIDGWLYKVILRSSIAKVRKE